MSIRRLDVFISSTGLDLADYRQAILDHMRPLDGFHAVAMEEFGARTASAVDVCRRRVVESDMVICLIGHWRGWEPDGDNKKRSMTEMEFDFSGEAKRPRLLFVAPEAFPVPLPHEQEADVSARQKAFRSRVLGSGIYDRRFYEGRFAGPHALAAAVIAALANEQAERMLERIRAMEAKGQLASPSASATLSNDGRALAKSEAALAEFAKDEDLDKMLADPKSLDIEKLQQAVAERAQRRAKEGKAEAASGRAKMKAAAADYMRLADLVGFYDIVRKCGYYELATKADPEDWQAHIQLGQARRVSGNLAAALEAFESARKLAEASSRERELAQSHCWVGIVLQEQGKLVPALQAYRLYRDGMERLISADPGNSGWQRDLSVSFIKVGDVLVEQGNLPEALKSFRNSLAIADRLAKADPGNSGWQRDLSVSQEKIGDVLVAQGNLPEALKSFRDSLAITDRLAKADPGNSGWQFDLGISNERIGDVLTAQGNLDAALKHYRVKHEIISRLAKADPGNSGWQRDLSVSYSKVGDVTKAQGNLPEALKSFRDSLAIRDRLAKADPGNMAWQGDLAASNGKVGQVYVALGDKAKAMQHFKAGRAIVAPFAERSGHQVWIGYLKSFDKAIAALEGK